MVRGFVINANDFASLQAVEEALHFQDAYLNDNVISSFVMIETELARDRGASIIGLETQLTTNLINGKLSTGFKDLLAKN